MRIMNIAVSLLTRYHDYSSLRAVVFYFKISVDFICFDSSGIRLFILFISCTSVVYYVMNVELSGETDICTCYMSQNGKLLSRKLCFSVHSSIVFLVFLFKNLLFGFGMLFLGRLLRVDLIKQVSNVRTYVHPSTESFIDFNEIWCVGRGR